MRSDFARLAVAVLLTAAALAVAAQPAPFQAEYTVLRGGQPAGVATMRLSAAGDAWTLRGDTRGTRGMASMVGLEVHEDSRFVWRDGLPEARQYHYRQRATLRSRERRLDVDPARGRIDSLDHKDRHALAYVPGVLDRQLVPLALAAALARDGAEAGRDIVLPVADREALQTHRYRVVGPARLDTPAGAIDTVELLRVREHDSGRVTRYWLDPTRGVIVRLLQTESGEDGLELRLTALTPAS